MARSTPPDEQAEDAVECFLCLTDPDADPRARARWSAWLSADPGHRDAYYRVRDAWGRPVPGDVWPTHAEILADPYEGDGPIPALQGRAPARFSAATLSLAGIAALLLVAIAGAALLRNPAPQETVASQSFRTERGEQRRIALSDGSSITLGPSSLLVLEGVREGAGADAASGPARGAGGGSEMAGKGSGAAAGASGRSARLEAGEAVFSIVHDPAHPFVLVANGGRIDDVGTVFGVAVGQGRATVTVVEGAVRVTGRSGAETVSLGRNEQVSFAERLEPAHTVDGRAATDWVRGRLAYVDRPLGEVAADLARYTTLDVVIADPAVASLHYTGTVETDAIDHWVVALERVFPVKADRDGRRLILRSAPRG